MSEKRTIHQLFIFNSKFAGKTEDTEHLKALYFYPTNLDEGVKQKSVGLSEALIKFSFDFSPNQPCEYMLNQKRKHVFYQPEAGYWIVMIINHGLTEETISKPSRADYYSLKNLIENEYQIFKMHFSTFEVIVRDQGVVALRDMMKTYFTKRIPIFEKHIDNVEYLDLFQGIQFLSIDGDAFLSIQSFLNQLNWKYKDVKGSIFYSGDAMIFNNLSHEDVKLARHIDQEITDVIHLSGVCYQLMTYTFKSIRICVLGIGEFDKGLLAFLDQNIPSMEKLIVDPMSQSQSYDEAYKYVYYNNMNLAYKSSLKLTNGETFDALSTLRGDFLCSKEGLKEIYIRTKKDTWIVANFFAEREFYHIFEHRQQSLIEVNENFRRAKQLFSVKIKK